MADKEQSADASPAAAAGKQDFDPAAYARAVVMKQLKLSAEDADAKVKDLGKAKTAELVEAGQAGDLAKVRALLA